MNKETDWEAIVAFCHKVNRDLEGPQTAIRLLVHKIQSPQEREALLSLTTIEACVKNCGRRFQQEIGKFRFLNEIIKVISPKYMGSQVSDRVRLKSIELLYGWSQVLSHEPKVKEAYDMLKRQGIIKYDPVHIDKTLEPLPPPPSRNSIFEDDEKSKVLSRLLRSKNADDLQAANRLIKNLVKQDMDRTEKASRRVRQLETVYNNIRLLNDMLQRHQPGTATQSDKEIMKELRNNLEKERPSLFQLASLTDERDCTSFSEITKANDEVVRVMKLYDEVINKADIGSLLQPSDSHVDQQLSVMSELASLSTIGHQLTSDSNSTNLLDDQLLGSTNGVVDDFGDFFAANSTAAVHMNRPQASVLSTVGNPIVSSAFSSSSAAMLQPGLQPATSSSLSSDLFQDIGLLNLNSSPSSSVAAAGSNLSTSLTSALTQPPAPSVDLFTSANTQMVDSGGDGGGLDSLEALGKSVLQQSLAAVTTLADWKPQPSTAVTANSKVPLNQLAKMSAATTITPSLLPSVTTSSSSVLHTTPASTGSVLDSVMLPTVPSGSAAVAPSMGEVQPLTDVFVPLDTIQPGSLAPVVGYDKNGIKILLHFGKDRPRPDVQVMAVSTMSNNVTPIKNFSFQAAVPKVMKIKLQPASATDLPAYNPILPAAAITQVMLIALPAQEERVRLKFKLSYSMNGVMTTDVGDIQFLCPTMPSQSQANQLASL